jgi:hypothetical protein
MTMRIRIHANEIRPGDMIRYDGRSHRVAGVTRRPGWSWSIAVDGHGWAIALDDPSISIWRD